MVFDLKQSPLGERRANKEVFYWTEVCMCSLVAIRHGTSDKCSFAGFASRIHRVEHWLLHLGSHLLRPILLVDAANIADKQQFSKIGHQQIEPMVVEIERSADVELWHWNQIVQIISIQQR